MNQRIRELQRQRERNELAASQRLGTFLDVAITELKPGMRMSKISELAAKVSASQKARESRVDQLMVRVETVNQKSDSIVSEHEAQLDAVEKDLQALEQSLQDMPGHNNPPE